MSAWDASAVIAPVFDQPTTTTPCSVMKSSRRSSRPAETTHAARRLLTVAHSFPLGLGHATGVHAARRVNFTLRPSSVGASRVLPACLFDEQPRVDSRLGVATSRRQRQRGMFVISTRHRLGKAEAGS
jgi:hypothetical protein